MDYSAEFEAGGPAETDDMVRLAFSARPSANHGSVWPFVGAELEKVASAIMAERRARYALFDQRLFAGPAWDILLVLAIAECRQRRVTVSQLCERIDVPMTTALRWIASMTEDGLLVRRNDMTDKRRKFIELSPDALRRMVQYCTTAAKPRDGRLTSGGRNA